MPQNPTLAERIDHNLNIRREARVSYCFVDSDLVLLDRNTGVILDVLRDVIPGGEP